MKPLISGFSYGYALTEELANGRVGPLKGAPIFPSLIEEGRAGEGNEVVLTGAGPVWLYLKIAHALHGKARRLIYRSPVTGDVVIFDHSPE